MTPAEEVKSRLDIVATIQDYIPLKAVGVNFKALCPFHSDKTPSFIVSKSKQIWHCFGCNEGGDIFSFLMRYEGIEFVEALRILAQKAGVTLRKQDPKITNERSHLVDICELASEYYHQCLLKAKFAEKAREYIQKRGITQEMIECFKIGFSPPVEVKGYDINNFLIKKGFIEQDILKAGLIIQSQRGFGYYDRFRHRVMFPLFDIHGRVVGLTSRILPGVEDGMGKYVNTPQTLIYNKSQLLYGLHLAKEAIRRQDRAVIVEGNMDVITAHGIGASNVLASSGTAITSEQIQLIKRFTNNLTIAFDMDVAGVAAAERALEPALREGMNIRILTLPVDTPAKDPDEFIRSYSTSDLALVAWEERVKQAQGFVKMMYKKYFDGVDLSDVEQKRTASHQFLNILKLLPDAIEQMHWLNELSSMIHVPVNILRETLQKKYTKERPGERVSLSVNSDAVAFGGTPLTAPLQKKAKADMLSCQFFGILLLKPDLIESAMKQLKPEIIFDTHIQALYKALIIYYTSEVMNSRDKNLASEAFLQQFQIYLQTHSMTHLIEELHLSSLVVEDSSSDLSPSELVLELFRTMTALKRSAIIKKINVLQDELLSLEKTPIETTVKQQQLQQISFMFSQLTQELNELESS